MIIPENCSSVDETKTINIINKIKNREDRKKLDYPYLRVIERITRVAVTETVRSAKHVYTYTYCYLLLYIVCYAQCSSNIT